MGKIPIGRELKMTLLKWLIDGIDWKQLAMLKYKHPLNDAEKAEQRKKMLIALNELGECAVLKEIGLCFPDIAPDYQRKHPYLHDTRPTQNHN